MAGVGRLVRLKLGDGMEVKGIVSGNEGGCQGKGELKLRDRMEVCWQGMVRWLGARGRGVTRVSDGHGRVMGRGCLASQAIRVFGGDLGQSFVGLCNWV